MGASPRGGRQPDPEREPGGIRTKVVGVTKANDDGSDRQSIIRRYCRQGGSLALVPEFDNPHDDCAIGVWVGVSGLFGRRWLQVGYIRSGLAEQLAGEIDEGKRFAATILDVSGGRRGENLGVNIEVREAAVGDPLFVAPRKARTKGFWAGRESAKVAGGGGVGNGCGGCFVLLLVPIVIAFFRAGSGPKGGNPPPFLPTPPAVPAAAAIPQVVEVEVVPSDARGGLRPADEVPGSEPEPEEPPISTGHYRSEGLLALGRNLEAIGKTDGAVDAYRKLIIRYPRSVSAVAAIARIKALQGKVPKEAEYRPVEDEVLIAPRPKGEHPGRARNRRSPR